MHSVTRKLDLDQTTVAHILKDANVIKLTCSGLMPKLASFTSIVEGRGGGGPQHIVLLLGLGNTVPAD